MFKLAFLLILPCIVLSGIKCAYSDAALELWTKIKSGTVPEEDLDKYQDEFKKSLGMTYDSCAIGVGDKLKKIDDELRKKLEEKISQEGIIILSKYTTNYYKHMNILSRDIDKNVQENWKKGNEDTMKWLQRIAVLSDTLKKIEEIIPFQGVVFRYEGKFPGWEEQYKKGSVFTTSSFTSTSTDEAPQSGIEGNDIKLKFTVKSGVMVSAFSEHEGENEVLLRIGVQFKIDEVNAGATPVAITMVEQ